MRRAFIAGMTGQDGYYLADIVSWCSLQSIVAQELEVLRHMIGCTDAHGSQAA